MIKRRMKNLTLLSSWKTAAGIGIPDYHQFQTTRGSLPIYIFPITCINQDFFPIKNFISTFHTCIISSNQICVLRTCYVLKIKVNVGMIISYTICHLVHYRTIEVSADGVIMRQCDDDGAIARR